MLSKRLRNELQTLRKNPDETITLVPEEVCMNMNEPLIFDASILILS